MSKTVVISGANRGIGLALADYYLDQAWQVIALCRQSSDALEQTTANVIEGVELADARSVQSAQAQLSDTKIDLLINNAGILRNEVLGQIDYDSIRQQFEVNTLGALTLTETLLDHFSANAKIAVITSRMGSMGDNTSGGRYGYRMSKAALNAASVSLAHDLKPRGISLAVIHPGLVGTDMIGGYGDVTPQQAADNIAQRISELNINNSGSFWHANGELLPW